MDRRSLKITLRLLFSEWNWPTLNKRKHLGNLIWTSTHRPRKDNRVVQNVGKPIIKFKFEVGSYLDKAPRHFSISTTGKGDRICWMALDNGDLWVKQRKGTTWQEPFKIKNFFENPANPLDDELDLLEVLVPGIGKQLPELLPGLHGVDAALRERFTGIK